MLKNFDTETFFSNYWQQKPLCIRAAFPDFEDPVDGDELAGLACEAQVESRLVQHDRVNNKWAVKHGPFEDRDFATIGERDWSLLVQGVDQWLPEVQALLEAFSFLNRWHLDDIMVSYAAPGGNVGPHFDYYDVFLVQGQGQRTWQIGQQCGPQSTLLANNELRLLADFQGDDSYTLNPGDILYIPPGYAHWGVSENNSLSYSVGFRAPSQAELLTCFSDYVANSLTQDKRFNNPCCQPSTNPGHIDDKVIDYLHHTFSDLLNNKQLLKAWFGEYMTESKYPENAAIPDQAITEQQLLSRVKQGCELYKNNLSRFAYSTDNNKLTIFADGQSYTCCGEQTLLAKALCQYDDPDYQQHINKPDCLTLLTWLVNAGALLIDE
jgi:50S ribosomal protein L16 3-hydroxylase